MKKMMNTVFGCFAAMAIALNGTVCSADRISTAAKATAKGFYEEDNTIDICVDTVTAEEAQQYSKSISKLGISRTAVYEGDYKVTVRIFNNEGFANTGFRLMYDSENFDPVVYCSNEASGIVERPVFLSGEDIYLGHHFSINRFEDDDTKDYGQIGWGTMSLSDVTKDGVIYSFFFSRKEGCPEGAEAHLVRAIKVVDWMNADSKPVECHPITNGCYLREETLTGDVDENGVVDSIDAIRMLEISTAMLTEQETLDDLDWNEECSVNPADPNALTYQVCYLSGACDVNDDNSTDIIDAMEILNYYVQKVVTDGEYDGCVGNEAFAYHFVKS